MNSQNNEEIISFGDSLFKLKNNRAALNEYQRAFYFAENNNKTILCKKIAGCYLISNEFDLASAFYDTASNYSSSNREWIECNLGKIQCLILGKKFGYALLKLDELETDSDEQLNFIKNLYQGICHFGLENYDEAFRSFNKNLNQNDSLMNARLTQLFDGRKRMTRPYPIMSSIMSAAIPGSGQIYSGNFYSGINSILLLSAIVCLGVYTPIFDFYIYVPFFYRYYMGGILHANRLANERKMEKQHDCYVELMKIFQENGCLKTLYDINMKPQNYAVYLKNSVSEIDVLLSFSFLFYKKYLSSQDVDACVYYPSCSVYTIETIEKNGVVKGLLDGFDRLLRCHPFVNQNDYQYNMITKRYYDAY